MSWVVTSSQLNQVNTPTGNNQTSQVSPNFEVSRTPMADFPICGTCPIEMSWVVTSSQLNQVNTPTGNNQTSQVPPGFEVSRTPMADFPTCGTPPIEMSWVVTSSQLNQVNTPTGNNRIGWGVWVLSIERWRRVMFLNSSKMLSSIYLASIISQYPWEVPEELHTLKGSMFASHYKWSVIQHCKR
jgi:hypothetical protein